MYISVTQKFWLAFTVALAWMLLSLWLSRFWQHDLCQAIGTIPGTFLIWFIAIIPGFINAFTISSLVLDKRPERKPLDIYPPISILVAAYNEGENIAQTLEGIERQNYPGAIEVWIIDDGSRDQTVQKVRQFTARLDWMRLIRMKKNGGKSKALNAGLANCSHDLILTIDGDSYLYGEALKRIVERYKNDPPNTRAVAGTTLVRNSRTNWVTRAQEWDYFNGIATIKRIQSLNQGTLVAQGAFSIYDRQAVIDAGGWPPVVGEDIVLTWALIKKGYRIGYCEDAVIFTNVPDKLNKFISQRKRWARGMVEAFKAHPKILFRRRLTTFFIWWNLMFPLLDLAFTFGFIPGVILACLGKFWIVGPLTLTLLPLAFLINWIMFRKERKMFTAQGLRVRRNLRGFVMYILGYSFIMQPASILGYMAELLLMKKKWGTK